MIQCIIFKFRKWHTCNYEWYHLYRSYENCRRPGVAILDMQMSKVPIISGYAWTEQGILRKSIHKSNRHYSSPLSLYFGYQDILIDKQSISIGYLILCRWRFSEVAPQSRPTRPHLQATYKGWRLDVDYQVIQRKV